MTSAGSEARGSLRKKFVNKVNLEE